MRSTDVLRVLSLGAGVQSTTLLLMACHGEIERPDLVIFADTQWEPQSVYQHLSWLETVAAQHGITIERVSNGNLRRDALSGRFLPIPAFIVLHGKPVMSKRQCTARYKIQPIYRRIREVMAERGCERAEVWLGLTLDEIQRMKPARVSYITNRWPLIERRMTRHDCLLWLEKHGYPRPPKSSCIGCPYHDLDYWRRLRQESPAEFEDACRFEEEATACYRTAVYLHRSLIPLRQLDLRSSQDRGQLSLWDAECEGMCGL